MSNYTKSTNFATKDNLTPGDPLKIVRGTEIDTEFNNIATAIATKTDNASAAITGGTINDTTIGATTASTGAFTTISATGAITSTLATGTAPLVVASTTKVTNLNVDSLDGADWASPAALGSTTPAAVSATTLSASGNLTLSGGTANGVAYLNGSKVVTSGSALTFDGTNLGVGVSSPNQLLDVRGANGIGIRFLETSTGNTNRVQLGTGSGFGYIDATAGSGSTALAFQVASSEQMRLTSTGLGIGTSSPSYKLDVAGAARSDSWIGRTNGSAPTADCAMYRPADNSLGFSTANTERMRIDSSGNLGIGTSSPTQLLTVKKDQAAYTWSRIDNQSSSASAYAGVQIGAFGNTWGLAIGSSAANSNALTFLLDAGGANSEKMRLDSSGNIGLGVTPSAWSGYKPLQAGSAASFGGYAGDVLSFMGSNTYNDNTNWKYILSGNAAARYQQSAGTHAWYTAPSGTAGNAITFTQAMTLDVSGNLGVGTTTIGSRLTIGDTGTGMSFTNAASGNLNIGLLAGTGSQLAYIFQRANSDLIFGTNNTERMRIDSSGNLGLGVSSFGTSAAKVLGLANATAPSSSPAGMGQLYVEGGALKFRGSSGTVTTIAPA